MNARALSGLAVMTVLLGLNYQLAWGAKYKVAQISNGGSISGTVLLDGVQPAPEKILITKNEDICGKGYRSVQWVPMGSNKGLQQMVVFLKKVKQGKGWDAKAISAAPAISQKNCLFSPWIQIVRRGDELTIRNSDPVLHNIHIRELIGIKVGKARGVKRTMLNEGQPGSPESPAPDLTTKIKPRRGNFIAINCEAHNFMFAWMFSANHPYAIVTGKKGGYRISDIPPGKYTLAAWHPTLGLQERKITVKSGGKLKQNFTYKPK